MVGNFYLSILIMFSRIFQRMDVVKQVSSGEETAIGLGLASEKSRKFWIIIESRDSIESRGKTPERGLEQVGRNDPSDIVSEGRTKKKGKFELPEASWDLEPVLAGYLRVLLAEQDKYICLNQDKTLSNLQ